jgi:hypothetical protein
MKTRNRGPRKEQAKELTCCEENIDWDKVVQYVHVSV